MGFSDEWISTVMRCVTNVRYAVWINGELSECFVPTRGLRQGDPISPYLFLLCAEGLSCLMKEKEQGGILRGVKNGRMGPAITHLLFADDNIFFTKGHIKNLQALKEVLNIYSEGSGQRINFQKSSVYFGYHCPEQVRHRVKTVLNVHSEAVQTNYLGMPSWVGRCPSRIFNSVYERMWKRIRGWSDRGLSRAGKEVMLKSVIQAIPTYIMSCFRLLIGICDKMGIIISNHWWGFEGGKKKMHWRSWEWLLRQSLLVEWVFEIWSFLTKKCWENNAGESSLFLIFLCAKVLKGRYFPHTNFWNAPVPRSPSYTWRSLMYGKDLLEKGILWRIGDGKKIRLTKDCWIPNYPTMLKPKLPLPDDLMVSFLIQEVEGKWNEDVIRECFNDDVAEKNHAYSIMPYIL